MNDWAILKSTNLVDWTLYEKAMTIANFKWANANAWASQMVTKNGKFYWYVPANKRGACPNNCGMAIGVAVSDSPTGPFTDPLGKPLIDDVIEMANWNYTLDSDTPFTIDPTVFVDNDGSAYMHYGSFGRTVHVKLGSDMISLDGKLTNVDLGRLGGVSDGKSTFFEAPFLMKRNGKWYEIYAAGANPAAINYSMADHPAGPWKAMGRVLDPLPNVAGQDAATNHAGVAEFAGQWYIVYHVSNGPNGGGTYQRQVAMEKLTFNADGTIKKVVPTSGMTFD
jgi:beta-xylosidase